MTPDFPAAIAAIEEIAARLEGDQAGELIRNVGAYMDSPAIPMFMRIVAMSELIAGAAVGAFDVIEEGQSVTNFHRSDLLPDIAALLRHASVLYDELERQASDEPRMNLDG